LSAKANPLNSYELRDLEELLNDEERELEEEIEEMEDIKKELLKKSSDVKAGSSHKTKKEVISVVRPPPEGEAPKRYTPQVPFDPNRIVIEQPSEVDRQKLPQTPKPPEKIEKPNLPPTPVGGKPIRTTPPYVPVERVPEENKIQPGPAFRPTPKYVWDGTKFVHIYPERRVRAEELRERRIHKAEYDGVSCADIKYKYPNAASGIYTISSGPGRSTYSVYCNMDYKYYVR